MDLFPGLCHNSKLTQYQKMGKKCVIPVSPLQKKGHLVHLNFYLFQFILNLEVIWVTHVRQFYFSSFKSVFTVSIRFVYDPNAFPIRSDALQSLPSCESAPAVWVPSHLSPSCPCSVPVPCLCHWGCLLVAARCAKSKDKVSTFRRAVVLLAQC